jgi:hypothetical protein
LIVYFDFLCINYAQSFKIIKAVINNRSTASKGLESPIGYTSTMSIVEGLGVTTVPTSALSLEQVRESASLRSSWLSGSPSRLSHEGAKEGMAKEQAFHAPLTGTPSC